MRRLAAFVAMLIVGAAPAVAQATTLGVELPTAVTLEQTLGLVDGSSPRALAERAAVPVVAADRLTAQALPNPTLSYGGLQLVGGTNTGAATQHQVAIEQPLLLFGQRGVRTQAADLRLAAEQGRVAAALAELRLKARQAFTALLARQEQLRVLEESLADFERVEGVVRGRAGAGDRSRYDVARIEVQTQALQVEVADAQTEITDAAGQMAAVIGAPEWRPRALGDLQPGDVTTDVDTLWQTAQEQRPSILALRQRQAAANGGLVLARRERWPIPSLAAGALVTQDADSTSAVFGFSVPLPLFDRNQGEIARAAAATDAESLALDAELAEAHAQIERAAIVLKQRRATLAALEKDVMQRVPVLRRMAEDAYREGSGGILELLDALTSLKDMRLLELKQLEAAKLAEGDLIAVAGLDAPAAPTTVTERH